MTLARFLRTRRPAWDRLEHLTEKTQGKGVSALSEDELHELTRLYPAVAVDVARARMYKVDEKTLKRINRIAIAAHGLLYRRRHVRPLNALRTFFARDYPRLFRRLWPYMALATALSVIAGLGAFTSVILQPTRAFLFVPGPIDLPDSSTGISAEDITERFRKTPKPPMAAGIMANNISVAFKAFAFGITAGVGTCYVLLFNAMMLGALAAYFTSHGLALAFWSTIVPHGVLEILSVLIAGAAGLRMGMALVIPGGQTRKASLRNGAREAVLLVLGTIPMFAVAAVIEGFVTPSFLPGAFKISLGLLAGVMALAYLLLFGRKGPSPLGIRQPW